MPEQELRATCADVWFDERDCHYAREENLGTFRAGSNTLRGLDALIAINRYDYTIRNVPMSLAKRNRLRDQRNCIVFAFGEDMAGRVGYV